MKKLLLAARMADMTGARHPQSRPPIPKRREIKSLEVDYLRDLRTYVKATQQAVRLIVLPAVPRLLEQAARERGDALRADTYLDELNRLVGQAADALRRVYPDDRLKRLATEAAARVNKFSADTTQAQVKAVAGIDVIANVRNLPQRVQDFTTDNVALIKSVSADYMDGVRDAVTRAVRSGTRAEAFSDDVVSGLEDVSESRAALIARDQVNKFNGELTRSRQTDLGVERYVWHNSDDARVRGNPGGKYPNAKYSHWDREGQIFNWSDPPPDGHPGFPVNCRCWAEPVLDDVI